ncbi:hypothetical protein ACFORL_10170 [Legionella dresdenensis]|uniref:Integral membrane protein n=1 Tax=Legionella dresdenensis TaxID=450200 RepID=A0ABV8CHD9_9GAMM
MSIPYIDPSIFPEILLFAGGGAMGDLILDFELRKGSTTAVNDTKPFYGFFQPCKDSGDTFRKIVSPITAPLVFSLMVAVKLVELVIDTVAILLSVLTANRKAVKDSAIKTGVDLLKGLVYAFAAVTSPLVNTVDVVGSGINSLLSSESCQTPSPQIS